MLNLEELGKLDLGSISLRVSGGRKLNSIAENFDDWLENEDMINKYTIAIKIEILGNNFQNEKNIKVGEVSGYFFESESARDDVDFYYLCDSISSDLEMMASSIVNEYGSIREEFCDFDATLMYIDRIYIEEKYRGLGIASHVIKDINEILSYSINLYPETLILLPEPQERNKEASLSFMTDERKKNLCKQKLIKLYKTLGFNEIENTNYMLKK